MTHSLPLSQVSRETGMFRSFADTNSARPFGGASFKKNTVPEFGYQWTI